MIVTLCLVMLGFANQEFFEMVEERQALGHTWQYVSRTEVTDEIAMPAVEEDGTKIYYWEIKQSD